QLLEHQNQNASTRLIIVYLGFIKKMIQLLRYSNLFDFDQLLISIQIGSIEKNLYITYLLSLCEHGDLHLRGACASLLATLIQTTIHLLLNNVHLYQLIYKTVQEIELLEDSIQHTTRFYVLAKVSLAQFIDDIDFRILTYLEQQQKQLKQQYPDIRVRQATASTFAKFVDHNSFLPCQWIYKIHHSLHVGCLEDIYVLSNVLRPTTIRPIFS
ncbi:unnamed protein product, partial [Rotaria sp. Silwood1]